MFKVIVMAVTALLIGCSDGGVYVKNGSTADASNPEVYNCIRDAKIAGGYSYYIGFGITERPADMNLYNACMRSKGYSYQGQPVAPSYVDTNAPPTPMTAPPNAMIMCSFPNNEPVKMNAFTCSQGRGHIVGPAI